MTLNLTVSSVQLHNEHRPRITVIGVGGGGNNAVDNMIAMNLQGVDFVVANTDAQQLGRCRAENRIQLGPHITQGLGAGAKPEVGRAAAEEAADELDRYLKDVHMLFVTAGMGGGTGTGAAPVIARMARERGILTVGVVTKPFAFEGKRRASSADDGVAELERYVDTLIVIPNQNLFRIATERTSFKEAFKMADNVLYMGVKGVTDLMISPGVINLDFADVRAVMSEMGKAMMGTGEAEGDGRASRAAELAISNPLLDDTKVTGARGLLINITGGDDLMLHEVDEAATFIREKVDEDANIIFGSAIDPEMNGRIRVSVVATGMASAAQAEKPRLVSVGNGGTFTVGADMVGSGSGRQSTGTPTGLRAGAAPMSLATVNLAPPPASAGFGRGNASSASAQPVQSRMAPPPMSIQPAEEPRLSAHADADVLETPSRAPAMPSYDDTAPAAYRPRTIPEHLAKPLQPQGGKSAAGGRMSGLFAARGEPTPPRGESLFTRVTGALRRGLPTAASHEDATRQWTESAEQHAEEPPRPNTRAASHEEAGLAIPAFLRRQTS